MRQEGQVCQAEAHVIIPSLSLSGTCPSFPSDLGSGLHAVRYPSLEVTGEPGAPESGWGLRRSGVSASGQYAHPASLTRGYTAGSKARHNVSREM